MEHVACTICGTKVEMFMEDVSDGVTGSSDWMGELRLLIFDVKDTPTAIHEDGRLIDIPPYDGRLEPEVYSPQVRRWVRTGAKLCPLLPGQEKEIYDGKCYVIHDGCWYVFERIARRVYNIPSGGFNSHRLDILVAIFESGRQVVEGFRRQWRLEFPHGFGDVNGEVGRYWSMIRDGNAQRGPLEENGLLHLDRFPDDGYVLVANDYGNLDAVRNLRSELGMVGMKDTTLALREDGYWVPGIGGLPVEIIIRILEFVGGEGIIGFGMIEGGDRRVKIPETVWKRQFLVRGEAGWADGNEYWKGREDLSWFERYLNVRVRVLGDRLWALTNYKRVWGICEGILDVIMDVEGGKVEGKEIPMDTELRKLERGVGVVVPMGRGSMEKIKNLRIEGLRAVGVMVSYVGSGKMRFVSGLRFLPGGEGIGIINSGDEVYVELSSKNSGSKMAIRVCYSDFGISGITTMDETRLEGSVQDGVKQVIFDTGSEGLLISGVTVWIDAFRVIGLWIEWDGPV
ncbi:hypothetical protein TWF730_002028 [Orbilia blumenaviensis]|uniref:Uncharacterized protein n=1 Tax=Orbilia blumenaviensis TaxID=1796055 RepID=A0AAV9UFW4_9PEZI